MSNARSALTYACLSLLGLAAECDRVGTDENDGLTLRQVIRDGPRDVEFTYTDEREPQEGDDYYVRVRQVNDAMAWSSPIWIGGYSSR